MHLGDWNIGLLVGYTAGYIAQSLTPRGWRAGRRALLALQARRERARFEKRTFTLARTSCPRKDIPDTPHRVVRTSRTSYVFGVEEIVFATGLQVKPRQLNVFIGPNNGGKTLALRRLQDAVYAKADGDQVYANVTIRLPKTMQSFHAAYDLYLNSDASTANSGDTKKLEAAIVDRPTSISTELDKGLDRWLEGDQSYGAIDFLRVYGPLFFGLLRTETRLTDCNSQSRVGFNDSDSLVRLYLSGRETERALSSRLKSVFGTELRLDESAVDKFTLRVGPTISTIPTDAREALKQLAAFPAIETQGDGLRSFVASLLHLWIGERPLLAFDEPEAFLHPTQAISLGRIFAEESTEQSQLFVATHSAHLLRGLIQKARPNEVNIVRLSYDARLGMRVTLFESSEFALLMKDPVLNATSFFEGLFHRGVALFEGNSDRLFFEAVHSQINESSAVYYTSAVGKDSAVIMFCAYRRLGVPVALVLDVDILRERSLFVRLLGSCTDSSSLGSELNRSREQIVSNLPDKSSWDAFKKHGVRELASKTRGHFENLTEQLEQYGVFINPAGELESSLTEHGLNYSTDKQEWVRRALMMVSGLHAKVDQPPWKVMKAVDDFLGD